jgi:hypothetical protein
MTNYTENIAIRVKPEDETAVEDYAEDNGLSKSGGARKLLYEGMDREGVKPDRDKKAMTDGGRRTTIRDSLTYLNALWGLMAVLGFVGIFVLPGRWSYQSLLVALASAVLTGGLSVVLWTNIPERIDRAGVSAVDGLKERLSGEKA